MREPTVSTGPWKNCLACGQANAECETRCERCGRPLSQLQSAAVPRRLNLAGRQPRSPLGRQTTRNSLAGPGTTAPPRPEGPGRSHARRTALSPADGARGRPLPENLRRQLSARVQEYRFRRLNRTLPLPFLEEPAPETKVLAFEILSRLPVRTPPPATVRVRPRRSSLVSQQPELNFLPAVPSESYLVPAVASLRRRMAGHCLDLALSLAAGLVFLLPLELLAGPVEVSRVLLAAAGASYLLLAFLYGMVFLWLAGATPAMKWMGLRLVNFDGMPARPRQRFWRLIGAIVSAGSFFLGFLWVAVDEERLSWHDRISKTFLTAAER